MKTRPLELLEESLQILRTGSADILILYWTGALPFAISILWMLHETDFSWRAPFVLRDSLCCAVAFLWMSYWKSVASKNILLLLAPESEAAVPWHSRLAFQSIVQTIKLFVMPIAALSLVAWPAGSMFFRSLALEPVSRDRSLGGSVQRAFGSATQRYQDNAIAFLTVVGFAVITFLNVLVSFAVLPSLWKMLTGYETDWSRLENPGVIFSLFSVAVITTWLLIDPWIQTYSILRVFYQNARSDGRDLLRDIARVGAIVLLCLMLVPAFASAAEPQQVLDQGIAKASQNVEYGWLRPPASDAPQGFLGDVAKKIREAIVSARDHIKSWIRSASEWLRDIFGNRDVRPDESKKGKPRSQELRWTLALLAVLVCGLIVALFLRNGKIRPVRGDSSSDVNGPVADVMNERILPSDVSQEEWMRLAFEYLANNQTRLAARAFYLANLSYLGAQSLLSLALWKSNRIYERELARQPRSGEITPAFVTSNRLYERAWYGMRELGSDQMDVIRGAAEQLRQHA